MRLSLQFKENASRPTLEDIGERAHACRELIKRYVRADYSAMHYCTILCEISRCVPPGVYHSAERARQTQLYHVTGVHRTESPTCEDELFHVTMYRIDRAGRRENDVERIHLFGKRGFLTTVEIDGQHLPRFWRVGEVRHEPA